MRESHIPPMPEGFTDRTAWDAIHFRFAGSGLMDQAMIVWQKENQDRVRRAIAAERESMKNLEVVS